MKEGDEDERQVAQLKSSNEIDREAGEGEARRAQKMGRGGDGAARERRDERPGKPPEDRRPDPAGGEDEREGEAQEGEEGGLRGEVAQGHEGVGVGLDEAAL